jgi:predicted ArsR family transcriptional regulator
MSDQAPPPEIPEWMKVVWKWDDSIGHLRVFVFFDCAVNAFKALLGEAGPNKTLEAIKPINKIVGNSMPDGTKQRFGPQGNDAEAVALPYYWFHCGTSNGNIKPMEIRDGMAIVEVGSCPCPQFNAPPELCVAISHYISEGLSEAVNPEYEFIWTHHLVNGDEYCRYVVKKKSIRYDPANLGKLEKTVSLDISKQEMGALATIVGWSQLNISTLASVNLVGSKRTIELAEPLAKKSGMKLGTKLMEGEKGNRDLAMVKDKLDFLGPVLMQSGEPATITDAGIEKEIVDCPLKNTEPEVCKHLEAMFNGVCEAINPDYEFAYDRMMSEGDHSCHWVVTKKGEPAREKPKEEAPSDYPMKILKMRFAKGEISEEEYRRQKAVLLE